MVPEGLSFPYPSIDSFLMPQLCLLPFILTLWLSVRATIVLRLLLFTLWLKIYVRWIIEARILICFLIILLVLKVQVE